MESKQIKLDGVIIPYCTNDEGVDYYPIKYVMEQLLLKGRSQLHKKENLRPFIGRYIIDFTFKGTTEQECYCMNKEGWIEYLLNIRKNKNKEEIKIKRLKIFHKFLGLEYKDETVSEYSLYTLRCIENFKAKSPKVKDKQCVKCERIFPNSYYFFTSNNRSKYGITNVCKNCNGINYENDNKEEKYIYETFGLEGFKKYMNDRIGFYRTYALQNDKINKNLNLNKITDENVQKEIILKVAKDMFDKNIIQPQNLCTSEIRKLSKIKLNGWSKIKNNELIEYCTEGDCKVRYWLYPKYNIYNMTLEQSFLIFKTYISDNVIIDDILGYEQYFNLTRLSRISVIFKNNICKSTLEFIVKFYNNKYPGYKFKLKSEKYYKNKENCIFDMKYFIEKDLNIPIEKIPLYVTKYSLNQKARSLYHSLRSGGYYKDLYTWINDCYPNKFIEADFNINPYRSQFDSLEEAQVDEQLKLRFKNVIYNPRDEEYKVNIMGMIPDWVIISEKGCYLVEYYGMYSEGNISSSHRLQRYNKNTKIKLNKYNELKNSGYNHLAIYPNDIKNNFEGLHKKIDGILN